MLAETRVGPAVSSDGVINPTRSDKTGAAVVTDAHARYQEAVVRGNTFTACNTASQALSLNSTTATGLILSNPANSGKNLVIIELSVALASLPTGVATLILTGNSVTTAAATVHTTPLAVKNSLVGGPANSIAFADSAATIANATIFRAIPGGSAATVAGSTTWTPFIKDEIAGALVLAPGTCLSLQSLTTAISVVASITWEEVSL